MQASDELTEAQVRQLLFDLDSSYQAFNQLLHSTWRYLLLGDDLMHTRQDVRWFPEYCIYITYYIVVYYQLV